MKESQKLAALAVARVLAGASLAEALAEELARHPSLAYPDKARAQDLSYGALRFYGELQAVLAQLVRKPLQDERLRALLLVALYQLVHTRAAPYAIVDQAVAAAGAFCPPAKGLVNALLRGFLRDRETRLQQAAHSPEGRYSHPQWWIDRLKAQYPEDYPAILEADNQHPPMALRVNRRRCTPGDYLELLQQAGVAAQAVGDCAILLERPVPIARLPRFVEGWVSVQDLAAQQAAPLLDLAPGLKVLDACSAPGGKAAHILELAEVELTALDRDPKRLARVSENLRRLGLEARIVAGDAGEPESWWDGKPFDRILADVPCSGSGVVRRHPDIKWLRRESDLAQFAREQGRLLDALWRVLARGGKLLYATCSVFGEENGELVEDFLQRHGEARPLPLPGVGRSALQLLPQKDHDGFFYALLEKT